MAILGGERLVDADRLRQFLLDCQVEATGGFAKYDEEDRSAGGDFSRKSIKTLHFRPDAHVFDAGRPVAVGRTASYIDLCSAEFDTEDV